MCGFRLQLETPSCSYFRTCSADLILFASWTKVSWVGLRCSLTVTLICICECSCSRHSMPLHSNGGVGDPVSMLFPLRMVWVVVFSEQFFKLFTFLKKLKYNHILPPSFSSNPCHGSNPTTSLFFSFYFFFFWGSFSSILLLKCCYKTLELLSNDVCTLLGWLWFSSILSVNEGILCQITYVQEPWSSQNKCHLILV